MVFVDPCFVTWNTDGVNWGRVLRYFRHCACHRDRLVKDMPVTIDCKVLSERWNRNT